MNEMDFLEKHGERGKPTDAPTPPAQPTDTPPADKHTDTPPADTPPPKKEQPSINDESVLKYLSENHKVKVSSISDMMDKLNTPEHKYASDITAAVDNFVKETGRNPQDYFKLGDNFDDLDKEQRIVDYVKKKNPGLTDEMVKAELKIGRLQPLDPEEHSEEEVAQRNDEILLNQGNLIKLDNEARVAFEQDKNYLAKPTDERIQQEADAKAWKDGVEEVIKNFDLEVEGFKYPANYPELEKRYGSKEAVLSQFVNDEGQFDFERMVKVIEFGLNKDNILAVISKAGNAKGQEDVIDQMANRSDQNSRQSDPNNQPPEVDTETMNNINKTIGLR